MTAIPIQPIAPGVDPTALLSQPIGRAPSGASFAQLMLSGVDQVNQKIIDADAMVRAFALDDSIPLHQVTFALEEAKDSFDLMMQVRSRLVEAYQEFSRMQL
ncbi:MAG: flagellar hook-basal body complex protein FliE [Caulobacterales bacterium]